MARRGPYMHFFMLQLEKYDFSLNMTQSCWKKKRNPLFFYKQTLYIYTDIFILLNMSDT